MKTRNGSKPTLILSIGSSLFKKTRFREGERDYRRLVADLMLKTYRDIGYDAINIGEYDLTMGINYLKEWQRRLSLPFISSNLMEKDGKLVFAPYKIVTHGKYKIGIIGVMKRRVHLSRVPDGAGYRVAAPEASVRKQVAALEKMGVDYIILLTDMTEMGCEKIAHLKLPINIVIGSSRRNSLSLPKVSFHRLILHLDRYGKHVGKLSLFCLGNGAKAKVLESVIFGNMTFRNRFIALKRKMPREPLIAARMDEYLHRIRLLKTQMALAHDKSEREAAASGVMKPKRFVGVRTCKKCHESEYRQWKETAHSHAYQSLVKKGNQYDADCIGCHAIGFRKKGGFKRVSKEMMPYVDVQCEACHGPGEKHVKYGGDPEWIHLEVPRRICIGCHTQEQSPDFIYQVYIGRLSCGRGKFIKPSARRENRSLPGGKQD